MIGRDACKARPGPVIGPISSSLADIVIDTATRKADIDVVSHSDRRAQRTAKGALYGRPNGTPAVTVCTSFRYVFPSRLLLRLSTKDTAPSGNSIVATSPGAVT